MGWLFGRDYHAKERERIMRKASREIDEATERTAEAVRRAGEAELSLSRPNGMDKAFDDLQRPARRRVIVTKG